MNAPKFKFGEIVYYVESGSHYSKKIDCPICYGNLQVEIILGNGEKQKIECGYCVSGYGPPSGKATTWGPSSGIRHGVINGISQNSYGGWRYDVGHGSKEGHEIFRSKEEAEPEQKKKLAEVTEQSKTWFRDSFIRAKKSQLWSAGYHKNQIKHHNKSIEWHEMRLGMCKEAKK